MQVLNRFLQTNFRPPCDGRAFLGLAPPRRLPRSQSLLVEAEAVLGFRWNAPSELVGQFREADPVALPTEPKRFTSNSRPWIRDAADARAPAPIQGALEFKHVSFRWEQASILEDIQARIAPAQRESLRDGLSMAREDTSRAVER